MKKSFNIFVLGIALSLAMAGCSSGPGKPSKSLNIEMSEFKFDPTNMVVYAGQEIILNLTNNGAIEHDFTILKKDAKASIPFDKEKQAADILVEYKLGAGKTASFTFILPEAGDYSVICGIQGHMESGMVAKITAVNP